MVRRLLSLSIVLAALFFQPAFFGKAAAETPIDYREALADTVQAAEVALSVLPATASLADHPPRRQALSRLGSIRTVSAGSAAPVAVDNSGLIRRFRGTRDEGRQAIDSTRQLLRALDVAVGKEDWTTGVDLRAGLREVLARPEFCPAGANPATAFLDNLRARLFRWLESLFAGIDVPQLPGINFRRGAEVLFLVLAGAMAVVSALFFAFVWRSSRHSVARYASVEGRSAVEIEDARGARVAAQRAADQGDYRQAINYLYLWAILHLAEQSRLRYDRSLTNREQLRAMADEAEIAEPLGMAVDTFDRLWYGHAACSEIEYGQFRSAVERIERATT